MKVIYDESRHSTKCIDWTYHTRVRIPQACTVADNSPTLARTMWLTDMSTWVPSHGRAVSSACGAFPRSLAIRGSPSGAGLLICIRRHLSASIPPKHRSSFSLDAALRLLRCFRFFTLLGVHSLKVVVGRTCHCMNDNEVLSPLAEPRG